jgi:hypothetical protein
MTMRPSDVSRTALICLLLGSWLSACERDKGPAAQGPSPASATQHLTAKLPSGWPSQVPTYPGGRVLTAANVKAVGTLVQGTSDPPAKVVDFYKAQLSALHLVKNVDKGATQSLSWSDDAQPPLRVSLSVRPGSGANSTFAIVRTSHTASDDDTDVAAAAVKAGAAAQ